MTHSTRTMKIILSGLFIGIAFLLPFFTGQIQVIGGMLLPMHLPVLLAGFICGAPYGLAVGFISPLLRSLTLGMPPFPFVAIPMAAELAAYGLLAGLFYKILSKKTINIYISLILSMVGGRIVWGVAKYLMLGIGNTEFSFGFFMNSVVISSIPGIILQIILIPIIIMGLKRAGIMQNGK